MGDHRFDDGEDLLLLVAGESGNGFELAFELGLGSALRSLRAIADAEWFFHGATARLPGIVLTTLRIESLRRRSQ